MPTQYSYLYGVVPATGSTSFGPVGIGGGDVRAVPDGAIAMVTGLVAHSDFSQLPPKKALQYLAEHQRVLERVMTELAVVPVKFGTVLEDDQQISHVLEAGREELTSALERYTGRVELDLAASWADLRSILTEIADDEAVVSMKAEIASEAEPTMEQRIELGQLVKRLLDKRREGIAARLVVALRATWPNVIVNPTRDDSMVLNAAVLIDRSEEDQFDRMLEKLNRSYENRLHFRCVGPLPPYSFATVEVNTTTAGDLNSARNVLELGESANLADIKAAHRRLRRRYHPDRNPDPEAAERVKEVSAAYDVLEQYVSNFKHRFHETAEAGAVVVKIKSLTELRAELTAQAA